MTKKKTTKRGKATASTKLSGIKSVRGFGKPGDPIMGIVPHEDERVLLRDPKKLADYLLKNDVDTCARFLIQLSAYENGVQWRRGLEGGAKSGAEQMKQAFRELIGAAAEEHSHSIS